jgi:hypothetical protein
MYPRKLVLTLDHIGQTVIMNNGDRAKVSHQDPDGGFWVQILGPYVQLKVYVNHRGVPHSTTYSSIIDERDYPRPEMPSEENSEGEN